MAVKKLGFLKNFNKKLSSMANVMLNFAPPARWYHTGNYALNKIMSGSFLAGVPESRVTVLAGPSGSGKTFLACNLAREAQRLGAYVLYIDTENAIDPSFVTKIGVSIDEDKFARVGITTLGELVEVLSAFLMEYEKEHGKNNPEAPPILIVLDSIDMLLTDTESDNFEKGEQKGDQGQRSKQVKAILRQMTTRIAALPISFIATHQVYQNQDVKNGEGVWIVNNSVKYSASQIFLCTKLKLKDGEVVTGIRMKVEAYKTRFAKTGSKIEIEVPYAKGMNPYSYFVDMMEAEGVVTKNGSWFTFKHPDEAEPVKFQKKQMDDALFRKIISHPKVQESENAAKTLMDQVESDPTAFEVASLDEIGESTGEVEQD
jgi:recombination protein RecA